MRGNSAPQRPVAVSAPAQAALAAVFVLVVQRSAHAYCVTTACPDKTIGTACEPKGVSDCPGGKPLFWKGGCVNYALQEDASGQVPFETADAIFKQAFATWSGADCGGGKHKTPSFWITELAPVSCTRQEYNQKSANANVILFRDDFWAYAGQGSTLALTTVTYNLDTGEIYDADMELNSANVKLTTSDSDPHFDLLSIATHEAGHFLGLSHSPDAEATMYIDYDEGSLALRDLNADDILAICTRPDTGASAQTCASVTPRHGFAIECGEAPLPDAESCCTIAPGAGASSGLSLQARGLLFTGALSLFLRRRRVRSHPREAE